VLRLGVPLADDMHLAFLLVRACHETGRPPQYAVELRAGEVVYHEVSELSPLPVLAGTK